METNQFIPVVNEKQEWFQCQAAGVIGCERTLTLKVSASIISFYREPTPRHQKMLAKVVIFCAALATAHASVTGTLGLGAPVLGAGAIGLDKGLIAAPVVATVSSQRNHQPFPQLPPLSPPNRSHLSL
ncbi:hypothetical protein CEXT_43221 [Caerostris extrusa]|uniref:Uncharacterized protein n=1 Tax=Caerostris extrusa TaxID=172846 RepID=A0AAV4N8T8_CAEEX|nr:hypothetical protein CEXT_43221 [Caerostris extrusa]